MSSEENFEVPVLENSELGAEAQTSQLTSETSISSNIGTSEEDCREEVGRIIKKSEEEIQQSYQELKGENLGQTEKRLEQLTLRAAEFKKKYRDKEKLAAGNKSSFLKFAYEGVANLLKPFYTEIFEQLSSDAADAIIFYYLTRIEEPQLHVATSSPNTKTTTSRFESDGWYELCSVCFCSRSFSTQIYKRLGNNPAALEQLISNHPELLLNSFAVFVLYRLCEFLPFDRLYQLMTTIRDESGRTCLFNLIFTPTELARHYQAHTDKLFELLSIQDKRGQTALHVNTFCITDLLILAQTPQQQNELIKLITKIQDENNKTALATAEGWVRDLLCWLIEQVDNYRYVLYKRPNVLIIYNTKNRPGAESEARSIYDAFQSTNLFSTYIEENKTDDEILKLIETFAKGNTNDVYESALIVVILSHGSVGVIDDCNGKKVSFTSIESAMCQKELQNRPKILITQCCQVRDALSQHFNQNQSNRYDIKTPCDRVPFVPKNSDFCSIMSSVPGEPSERGKFIPKLATQIEQCKPNETIDMLVTRVSQQMSAEKKPQTPIIQSTLTAVFCPMNRDPVILEIIKSD